MPKFKFAEEIFQESARELHDEPWEHISRCLLHMRRFGETEGRGRVLYEAARRVCPYDDASWDGFIKGFEP